jgi:2-oxoisovalerate dehydrogenase E1 component alpha subunit
MSLLKRYQTKKIVEFNIQYLQFLNEKGQASQSLPDFAKDKQSLIGLYRDMVFSRTFDKKAVNLQRTGKLGTYPSMLGQEALFTGIGDALLKSDVWCGAYRELGIWLKRGVQGQNILSIWGGDERGNLFDHAPAHDTPLCTLVAGQLLHAAGIAYALQYKHKHDAVLATVGDGGTSKGEFYEALNFAGLHQLPLVCLINNNCWAISTHVQKQTAAQTFAQKGIAGGWKAIKSTVMTLSLLKPFVNSLLKKHVKAVVLH